MSAIRIWSLGRHPLVALGALVAALTVCVRWWYVVVPSRLLGQFHPRWIPVSEIVPLAAGIVAIVALAPRVPRIDALGGHRRRAISTAAVLVAVSAAALIPAVTIYSLSAIPREWVPAYENYVPPGGRAIDAVDLQALLVLSATVLFVAGATTSLVAVFGAIWGAAGGIASYVAIILVQSTDLGQALATLPTSLWVAASLLIAVAGLTTWYRTGASATALARLM